MSGQAEGQKLEQTHARYEAERAKRLRSDGNDQYREMGGVFANFNRDPWAPIAERAPRRDDVDVLIVGAGLGGLLTASRLAEQGIHNIRLVDKAADFGGTWYWNRYPGAACDIESYIYMPFLEETGYIPTEKYAKAPEIFEHCQRIARHFNLYDKAIFQTEVSDMRWDDGASRWTLTTNRGDLLTSRFVVVAGGMLHKAKLPGTPGLESFGGHSFHTSRWDYAYTGGSPTQPMDKLTDKRVALIGTGATSVQIAPQLAKSAQHLYVVQRTPSGVGVRANRPTEADWASSLSSGWQLARMENFTRIVSGERPSEDLVADGWTEIFQHNPDAMGLMTEEHKQLDFEAMEAMRRRIVETVDDPATAEALKPWYHQMCKRPCFHDEYLPSFNNDNVTLIDTDGQGVERITEKGLVVNGQEIEVDCIVYASGFEVSTSYQRRLGFEIYGRGGVGLAKAWEDGAATLHGFHARGFPNLVMFSMTQGGIAINFAHLLYEQALHTGWYIAHCLKNGVLEAEPTVDAQDQWYATLLSGLGAQAMFYGQCTPSYMNAEGTVVPTPALMRGIAYFGGTMNYVDMLQQWRAEGAGLADMEIRYQDDVAVVASAAEENI